MRRFYRLTDVDDAHSYYLPKGNCAEELSIKNRTSLVDAVGEDGAFDLHGLLRSPLEKGEAALKFSLVAGCPSDLNSAVEDLFDGVYGGSRVTGLRKLWRCEDLTQEERRWSLARLQARPTMPRGVVNVRHLEVGINFALPDPYFYSGLTARWLAANGYTVAERLSPGEPIDPYYQFAQFDITTNPFNFSIINEGTVETRHCVFRLESLSGSGFNNPTISNVTTGLSFSSTTDGASASHVLSVNSSIGLGRAQLSVDGGGSWADDTPNLVVPTLQARLMALQPGVNSFQYTEAATPNMRLLVWFLPAFWD